MRKLGEILQEARQSQEISQEEAAKRLLIKKSIIENLENGNWSDLPDPAFVKGFITNYAQLLNLDSQKMLALYRAEFDEQKYPKKPHFRATKKRFTFTPEKIIPLTFITLIVAFALYLAIGYTSVLSAPKLQIFSPQDDITINTPVIEISGQTKVGATVSIEGEIVQVDPQGNFSRQIKLEDGRNVIEIVSSYRFSPKAKAARIVRLSR